MVWYSLNIIPDEIIHVIAEHMFPDVITLVQFASSCKEFRNRILYKKMAGSLNFVPVDGIESINNIMYHLYEWPLLHGIMTQKQFCCLRGICPHDIVCSRVSMSNCLYKHSLRTICTHMKHITLDMTNMKRIPAVDTLSTDILTLLSLDRTRIEKKLIYAHLYECQCKQLNIHAHISFFWHHLTIDIIHRAYFDHTQYTINGDSISTYRIYELDN